MIDERRNFNRVDFHTKATLFDDGNSHQCKVIDISIHGVLLAFANTHQLEEGLSYRLNIPLDNDNNSIEMSLIMKNKRGEHYGLECTHIDLDSITHLRRLVELNLGDNYLLDRDFLSLVKDNEK